MVSFNTRENVEKLNWLTVVGYNTIVLRVKSCDQIKIVLAATLGKPGVSKDQQLVLNSKRSQALCMADVFCSKCYRRPGPFCQQVISTHSTSMVYTVHTLVRTERVNIVVSVCSFP